MTRGKPNLLQILLFRSSFSTGTLPFSLSCSTGKHSHVIWNSRPLIVLVYDCNGIQGIFRGGPGHHSVHKGDTKTTTRCERDAALFWRQLKVRRTASVDHLDNRRRRGAQRKTEERGNWHEIMSPDRMHCGISISREESCVKEENRGTSVVRARTVEWLNVQTGRW